MKCFYHNADFDGICSAAIVHRSYPYAELIGINYGDEFPWDTIGVNEIVYMVDFSLQPFEQMIRLNNQCDLIWIDHHKTAIESRYQSGEWFHGAQKVGIGACKLVWDYLNGDKYTPLAVLLLAKYDVWDLEDRRVLEFQYGVRVDEGLSDPTDEMWANLFDPPQIPLDETLIDSFLSDGEAILRYIKEDNEKKVMALCFDHDLDGLHCIAANFGPSNSKLFDSVWDPQKYDAMLLFSWKKDKWTISLYSTRDDIDVSEVCKARGGGGHKQAGGFQCQSLSDIGLDI